MATMRAARFDTATGELSVQEVPVPRPAPGEALVRVAACGICHSDLSLLHGLAPSRLPVITPGHEAAGEIDGLGSPTPGWNVGDRVVLAAGKACGACRACVAGGGLDDCLDQRVMAFDYDGAWAEYVVVPVAALCRVSDSMPLEQAAVLADAVSTPYAAVVESGRVRPAESVGIWGLGGVGTHLVQAARLVGAAPIIALDPLPAARERALELGADHALDPTAEGVPDRIAELTEGAGLDVAFDVVARSSTMAQANAALGHRGRLVLIGVSPDQLDLGPEAVYAVSRHTTIGHLGYRKSHLQELVRLVSLGRLDVSRSVSAVLPLEDIAEGIRRLENKEGNPVRIVIKP
ncbi:zinc-binding dehydrogenase [Streptomyces telluris]|uniref:Zinc-binding dehydrogenase n=1 Tax=Streptomyces telluris TaxID=2720021 RepID=A0A9X2LHF5_9ACTN|nr:zinc-binding dehydrogenase [Streptomyces telluris]MCQ8771377.1 zinc-binding dehydrogenase [Streptomyces telluris]NJP77318.1 alcohol dehydrogenase catalytic domain-containing protein [Streptomyces telluris]